MSLYTFCVAGTKNVGTRTCSEVGGGELDVTEHGWQDAMLDTPGASAVWRQSYHTWKISDSRLACTMYRTGTTRQHTWNYPASTQYWYSVEGAANHTMRDSTELRATNCVISSLAFLLPRGHPCVLAHEPMRSKCTEIVGKPKSEGRLQLKPSVHIFNDKRFAFLF